MKTGKAYLTYEIKINRFSILFSKFNFTYHIIKYTGVYIKSNRKYICNSLFFNKLRTEVRGRKTILTIQNAYRDKPYCYLTVNNYIYLLQEISNRQTFMNITHMHQILVESLYFDTSVDIPSAFILIGILQQRHNFTYAQEL